MVNINRIVDTPVGPTVSAYLTFYSPHSAALAAYALDGVVLDGFHLRASFGTTKYCSFFLRGQTCTSSTCLYLHDIAPPDVSFTKEQMNHAPGSPFFLAIRPSTESVFDESQLLEGDYTDVVSALGQWKSVFPPPYTCGKSLGFEITDNMMDWVVSGQELCFLSRLPRAQHFIKQLDHAVPKVVETKVEPEPKEVEQKEEETEDESSSSSDVTLGFGFDDVDNEEEVKPGVIVNSIDRQPILADLTSSLDADLFNDDCYISNELISRQELLHSSGSSNDSSECGLSLLAQKDDDEKLDPHNSSIGRFSVNSLSVKWSDDPVSLCNSIKLQSLSSSDHVALNPESHSFGPLPLNIRSKEALQQWEEAGKKERIQHSLESLPVEKKGTVMLPNTLVTENESKTKKKIKNPKKKSKKARSADAKVALLESEISKITGRMGQLESLLENEKDEDFIAALDELGLDFTSLDLDSEVQFGVNGFYRFKTAHSYNDALTYYPESLIELFPNLKQSFSKIQI
ncbi:hypothetical protein GEMRC1_008143 [Eukaryota sp. GEM-RC1]